MRLTRIAFLTLFPLALLAVLAYALWVEPARVAVVRHDLRSVGAVAGGAIRFSSVFKCLPDDEKAQYSKPQGG